MLVFGCYHNMFTPAITMYWSKNLMRYITTLNKHTLHSSLGYKVQANNTVTERKPKLNNVNA